MVQQVQAPVGGESGSMADSSTGSAFEPLHPISGGTAVTRTGDEGDGSQAKPERGTHFPGR
ncbi:hypothetical protein VUR80DRAFT_9575 [Thermomyces stellatus]